MTSAFNLSQLANFVNTGGQLDASVGLFNSVSVNKGGTNATTPSDAKINLEVITALTGSEILPVGTTAERDATPQTGYFRFNTDTDTFEGYNGTAWGQVGGGATGGGNDQVFVENGVTVTVNYTFPTGKNAMSVGAITINSGVTVTIPTGQRWVIL
jgi:hypothetical protein